MGRVLSVKMNDAAVGALGLLQGLTMTQPQGGLAPGLWERIRQGIVRHGDVLTWATSVSNAAQAPTIFKDLTAWECAGSSFHVEDFVNVDIAAVDDSSVISEEGQQILLQHGLTFALQFSRLVYAIDPPTPVRCILAVNATNATFRFHQIRPGELWNLPELDRYQLEKVVVIDIEPAGL